METRVIKCVTCSEVLGTIQKPMVTEYDIEKYREMITCSQGHGQEHIELEVQE